MSKKISVYDLLGLIKDGKAPKKIIYNDNVYEFTDYDYRCIVTEIEKGFVEYWLIGNYNQDLRHLLNEKVEILEEYKPKIYPIFLNEECGMEMIEAICDKLNEIIDYINRKEDK